MKVVRGYLNVVIMFALAIAFVHLSYHVRYTSDWTKHGKHSLSSTSLAVLKTFEGPIRGTAYLSSTHPMRENVSAFMLRYKRYYPELDFSFIDPAATPQLVRDKAIKDGEVVIEYRGRSERTARLTEQSFTSALARLARNSERYIVFVTGHGERSPNREANHDVSEWVAVLRERGLKIQELNITAVNAIPDNTSLLVIASPQLPYLDNELKILAKYISQGGNLLWLSDPEEPPELATLGVLLEIDKVPGTVVDPASLSKGMENPALILNTTYTDHRALERFNLTTLFIYANAFAVRATSSFSASILVTSSAGAWSETSKLEGNVGFDENADFAGPLSLGIALERKVSNEDQRIVALGDGDFVSNSYLQNAGNQDFGVRLIEWLVSEDSLIDVPSRTAADTELKLNDWQKAVIGFGFLFVIPGALLLNGILVWNKRKRA